MKKNVTIFILVLIGPLFFSAFTLNPPQTPGANKYIVVAWNDLGMHCANKDFSNMAILPP